MKSYCTLQDVLNVVPSMAGDIVGYTPSGATYIPNTGTIPQATVTAIIEEASEMVRHIAHPVYNSSSIDALDPDYPPVIVYLTKIYAGMLMLERYTSKSAEHTKSAIEILQRQYKHNKDILLKGDLTDTNGNYLTRRAGTYIASNASDVQTQIEELYENGRLY